MPARQTVSLCSRCRNIVSGKFGNSHSRTGAHHSSAASFVRAVRSKCYLCHRLWNAWESSVQERILLEFKVDSKHNEAFTTYHATHFEGSKTVDLQLQPWTDLPDPIMEGRFISHDFAEYEDHVTMNRVSTNTGSQGALAAAERWLRACKEEHQACNRVLTKTNWTPTRLLELSSNISTWKLICPKDETIEVDSYMTLSYSWGGLYPLRLLEGNLEELKAGLSNDELPRTFREAMDVCRAFGVKHLWIDSLCIIQDSDTDWAYESTNMHQVYGKSICNIAASASRSPLEGLFRDRTAADLLPIIKTSFNDRENHCISEFRRTPYIFANYENLPLLRRGWVLQERILAPRVLHFGEHQLFWECDEKPLLCEAFENGIPGPPSPWSPRPLRSVVRLSYQKRMLDTVLELWFRVVRSYTRAHLTYDKDKFVAVYGIAQLFQQTGDSYHYGCWDSRLVECLTWVTDQFHDPVGRRGRPSEPTRFRRTNPLAAPTWSWMSVVGPVSYASYMHDTEQLILLSSVLSSSSESSHVSSGYQRNATSLRLRGPLLELRCRRRDLQERSVGVYSDIEASRNSDCIILDVDDEHLRDGDTIYVMLLCVAPSTTWATTYGMVLIRETDQVDVVYERVGSFQQSTNKLEYLFAQQQTTAGAAETLTRISQSVQDEKATLLESIKRFSRDVILS